MTYEKFKLWLDETENIQQEYNLTGGEIKDIKENLVYDSYLKNYINNIVNRTVLFNITRSGTCNIRLSTRKFIK